jgi:hypothetical protein
MSSSSGVNRNEINYNEKTKYVLTKEEEGFVYSQISYRKIFFEQEIQKAAGISDIKRIKECVRALDMIETIQKKLLG